MERLTEMEKSALAEFGNISMGSSATALSNLLNQRVSITTPQVSCSTLEKVKESYPVPCVVVKVEYIKGLDCKNLLIIDEKDAMIIANLMMEMGPETEVEELDEIRVSAISEAMNQMMGSAATAMSELFNMHINISPPVTDYLDLANFRTEDEELDSQTLVTIKFRIEVGNLIDSQLLLLIPETFAKDTAGKLLNDYQISEAELPGTTDDEITDKPEALKDPPAEYKQVAEAISKAEESDLSFSDHEIDALREIGNISMGSAATALSTLLDKRVSLTAPTFKLTSLKEVRDNYPIPCVIVEVQYCKGFEGQNILIIKEVDARIIAGIMMGEDLDQLPPKLNEIQLSAVSEAMNQMMGSASTAMSDLFSLPVQITPPAYLYKDLSEEELPITMNKDSKMIQISFRMKVGNLIDSELIQLLPLNFSKKMVSQLLQGLSMMGGGVPAQTAEVLKETSAAKELSSPLTQKVEEDFPFPFSEEEEGVIPETEEAPWSFMDTFSGDESIELIKDIPVKVTGVLGRAKMKLRNVLELNQGSIVELDRLEGEPINILANGKLVARGEIVVIEEQFGVRITEILRLESDRFEENIY